MMLTANKLSTKHSQLSQATVNIHHFYSDSSMDASTTIVHSDTTNLLGKVGSMFILLIILCGSLGNLTVLVTICREEKLRQLQHYVLVASLAASDCAFNTLIMPFYIETWWHNSQSHSSASCYYYNYLGTVLLQLSGYLIVYIAFNRYLLVAHTKLYKRFENIKVSIAEITIAILLAFIMVAPSLDNVEDKVLYQSQLGRCNFNRQTARTVVYAVFVNFVILPFIVVATLYILVIYHLRKSWRKVAHYQQSSATDKMVTIQNGGRSCKSPTGSLVGEPSHISGPKVSQNKAIEISVINTAKTSTNTNNLSSHRNEYHRRLQVAKSFSPIIAIFVAYLVTYIPFTVINMVDSEFKLSREYYMISSLFFWCSSCLNPWIYGIMNKELNTAIKNLFKKVSCKNTRTGPTRDDIEV